MSWVSVIVTRQKIGVTGIKCHLFAKEEIAGDHLAVLSVVCWLLEETWQAEDIKTKRAELRDNWTVRESSAGLRALGFEQEKQGKNPFLYS